VRRLAIDVRAPLGPQLAAAADAISRGLVVAFPTDTLYGLAADPRSERALARLFDLKGRDADRVVALAAADLAQVRQVAQVNDAAARLAEAFWPGPLTLVLPRRPGLEAPLAGGGHTVGIRVPDHPVARALALVCGHPVTATSANRTGRHPLADPGEVVRQLPALDLIVDAGPAPGGAPSTVVDLSQGPPILVRSGAVPWNRVLESLASVSDSPTPPLAPDGNRVQ
jgi:L-threonylcarbamoyladenylate synthase